jgi:hypothetical protein
MAADPEPEAPPLGPERSRESLPDESLDLDARAVESPRTEPQDPAGDASHARGVDDASRSARHQVVTSATPSHGSSVIDAVVDAAVDASMETEEARLEDVRWKMGKDDEADDEADARVVSSDVPAAKPPPSLERRAPPPPAPRGRGASGEAEVFRDADVSLVSLDEGDATVPRDGIENRPEEPSGGVEKTNASASASPAKTKTLSVTTNPLTSSALFARVGASRPEDVTSVNLTGCAYDSIEPGAFFAAAPFLERLVAAENGFTSADLAELGATLTHARRLNVACNRVDDTFAIRPSQIRPSAFGAYARDLGSFFPALTVLDARGNAMGAAALAELGKLPSLERLDVSGNAIRSLPSQTSTLSRKGEGVDSKASILFFPKLTHLDVSAQTPKMRFTVPELAAALGSCPRLRVVVARKNAGFSESSSDASCVLTPGIDFPALRALDLRENALRDPASVAPLCALATRDERRRRRGTSDVGVAGGGRDDADDDEENRHDAFFETSSRTSRGAKGDPRTTLFDSTVSSFGSATLFESETSADASGETRRLRESPSGRLEEVALGGNACADVLLTRLMARLAESAGPASVSKLSTKLSSLRLTPRERLERALASKSALFRGVEPPTRFGGAAALATPARVVPALAARALGEETLGEETFAFVSKTTNAKDDFSQSTERGAVFTLADGGADGVLPRTSLDMRRMATASAASPARVYEKTKLAFDFEKRVPDALSRDACPDDPFFSTTDAASAYASRLDARLATDRRKALSRKYAESKGIAGETRARARAAARARSAQTLGWVVDDEYTGK